MKIWNLKNSGLLGKSIWTKPPMCLCNWGFASIRIKNNPARGAWVSVPTASMRAVSRRGFSWYFLPPRSYSICFFGRKITSGKNERLEPPNQWGGWLVCSDDFSWWFFRFPGSPSELFQMFLGNLGKLWVKKDPNLIPRSLALDPIFCV